jgi:hypothetical protein
VRAYYTPVLYIRSFDDDELMQRTVCGFRREPRGAAITNELLLLRRVIDG